LFAGDKQDNINNTGDVESPELEIVAVAVASEKSDMQATRCSSRSDDLTASYLQILL
jgi:hypothetical protein